MKKTIALLMTLAWLASPLAASAQECLAVCTEQVITPCCPNGTVGTDELSVEGALQSGMQLKRGVEKIYSGSLITDEYSKILGGAAGYLNLLNMDYIKAPNLMDGGLTSTDSLTGSLNRMASVDPSKALGNTNINVDTSGITKNANLQVDLSGQMSNISSLASLDVASLMGSGFLSASSASKITDAKTQAEEQKHFSDNASLGTLDIDMKSRAYEEQKNLIDTLTKLLVLKAQIPAMQKSLQEIETAQAGDSASRPENLEIGSEEHDKEVNKALRTNAMARLSWNEFLTLKQQIIALRLKAKAQNAQRRVAPMRQPATTDLGTDTTP
ncbi:MAG: hypothetical protein LBU87_03880 [Lactobacillales bacterium]|jgi:hypothetical protein|nr:hypothetical protein [Lactobacillales bacterium]